MTTSNKQVQLEFHAGPHIKINAIFADSSKQFKHLKKKSLSDSLEGALSDLDKPPTIDPGQQMSPEEQRRRSLSNMNRRNGR